MTGGAFRNSSNLLGRKRELDELKEQIDNLKSTASKAAALDAQLKTSRDQLRQDIDKYNSELQQAYLKKNTLTMSIDQVKEKLAEMSAKIGRNKANVQKSVEKPDITKGKGKEESL